MSWQPPTDEERQSYLNAKADLKCRAKNRKPRSIGLICFSIFETPLSKHVSPSLLTELAEFLELGPNWVNTATKHQVYQRSLACSIMDAWIFYSHGKALNPGNHEPAELYLSAFKESLKMPDIWKSLQSLEVHYYKLEIAALPKRVPFNLDEFDVDKSLSRSAELRLEHISEKDREHAKSIQSLMTKLSLTNDEKMTSQLIQNNLKTVIQATMDGDSRFFKKMVESIGYVQPEDTYIDLLELLELPVTTPSNKKKCIHLKSTPLWCRRHWISRLLWVMDRHILGFEPVGLSKPEVSNLYNRDRLTMADPSCVTNLFEIDSSGGDKDFRVNKNSATKLQLPTWKYLTQDLL